MDGEKPKRAPTHVGDRNEDRRVRVPTPRGVGLTEPPVMAVAARLAVPQPIVPRHEFDFDQATPPAMDPNVYHALRTFRDESLGQAKAILDLVKAEVDVREAREAARLERRGKYSLALITAIGVAIASIVAAIVHGCS